MPPPTTQAATLELPSHDNRSSFEQNYASVIATARSQITDRDPPLTAVDQQRGIYFLDKMLSCMSQMDKLDGEIGVISAAETLYGLTSPENWTTSDFWDPDGEEALGDAGVYTLLGTVVETWLSRYSISKVGDTLGQIRSSFGPEDLHSFTGSLIQAACMRTACRYGFELISHSTSSSRFQRKVCLTVGEIQSSAVTWDNEQIFGYVAAPGRRNTDSYLALLNCTPGGNVEQRDINQEAIDEWNEQVARLERLEPLFFEPPATGTSASAEGSDHSSS